MRVGVVVGQTYIVVIYKPPSHSNFLVIESEIKDPD
jgi:hypothetical protein